MRFEIFNLTVKNEMKGEKPEPRHKPKTVAWQIVESLLKNDPDEVRTVIRYIRTQQNDPYMSEKLVDVQRMANKLISNPPEELKELTGGNDWVVVSAPPFSKNVSTKDFNSEDGYEDVVKVQEVKFFLKERQDLKDHSEIKLSVAENSSNAGAVGSRAIRNVLVDKKETKITFVLSRENKQAMCSKFISMSRIIGRMAKEPGVQIHESLPADKMNVKIRMEGPYIREAKTKEGRTVFVHEYALLTK